MQIIESIKRYAALAGAALLVILYALFKRRGQEIAQLETAVKTTKVETELTQLKKESDDARINTETNVGNYNRLKSDNRELSEKLGIGTNQSDTGRDSENN
jgi:hypothetical protein